jgi:hypothetical protein
VRLDAVLAEINRKLDELLARSNPRKRFRSVKGAGAHYDLSEDSIRRLVERGELVAYRPVPGRILIDCEQLEALILGSTRRPVSGRGIRQRPVTLDESEHIRATLTVCDQTPRPRLTRPGRARHDQRGEETLHHPVGADREHSESATNDQ